MRANDLVYGIKADPRDFDRGVIHVSRGFDRIETAAKGMERAVSQSTRRAARQMEQEFAQATTGVAGRIRALRTMTGDARSVLGGGLGALSAMGPGTGVVGVVGGFAGGAAIAQINTTTAAIADMRAEAERAGLSFQDFQSLKFAFGQERVSLDALTDGFKELQLRADEFIVTGKGPAADAFQRIGYSAGDLKARLDDVPELLFDIMDRVKDMDRAAQIRIFDELLGGTGGEQFVQLLDAGVDSLREAARYAERNVNLTDKMGEEAEEVYRWFNQVSEVIDSRMNEALIQTGKVIKDISDLIEGWAGAAERFMDRMGNAGVWGRLYQWFDGMGLADNSGLVFRGEPGFGGTAVTVNKGATLGGSHPSAGLANLGGPGGAMGAHGQRLVKIVTASGQSAMVNAEHAAKFQGLIKDLEAQGYIIRSLGGYNNRTIAGTNTLSNHAFGNAIDINPAQNPMGPNLVTDMPTNIAELAKKHGLGWGGTWTSKKDAMHFEAGSGDESAVQKGMEDAARAQEKLQDDAAKAQERRAEAIAQVNQKIQEGIELAQIENEMRTEGTFTSDEIKSALDQEREVRQRLQDLEAAGVEIGAEKEEQIRREIARKYDLIAANEKLADASQADLDRIEDLRGVFEKFGDQGIDAFFSIIQGAQSAEDAIKSLGLSLAKAMMQATLLGTGPLGKLFGGGLLGAIFPGKAIGGPVSAGQAYEVGENGRELFVPGENGTIVSGDRMRAMMNRVMTPGMLSAAVPGAAGTGGRMVFHNHQTIDLAGANGDETIRRISAAAAQRGMEQAIAIVQRDFGGMASSWKRDAG